MVQLLLHNRQAWWKKRGERHKPILMICYTNHALDQFLEYCIKQCSITQGVVRVGGRSRSENLKNFMLRDIKKQLRQERKIDQEIYYAIRNEHNTLSSLRDSMNRINQILQLLFDGLAILDFEILKTLMNAKHLNQFSNGFYPDLMKKALPEELNNFKLLDWLGLIDIDNYDKNNNLVFQNEVYEKNDDEYLKQHMENLDLNKIGVDYDENDDDDADSMNEERMLEDDLDANENLNKNKTKFNVENILKNSQISSNQIIDHFKIDELRKLTNSWQVKGKGKNQKFNLHTKELLLNMFDYANNKYYSIDLQSFEDQIVNIYQLDYPQRFLLYYSWVIKFREAKNLEIETLSQEYNKSASNLKDLRLQEDRLVMNEALIIAMTTTGASRYHSILKDIGPRIVIVEEAAEVFEAHIVSALSKHCEHLILIGDHVQLRPNPAVYKLAKDYALDISLFERLINNDTKKVMLTSQHRMRPEISVLMQNFYPIEIQDNENVKKFQNIVGLKDNIFFLNHGNFEKKLEEGTTKVNDFETEFLAKFSQYLIKQSYSSDQITILTMYLGQMSEIKRRLKALKLPRIKVTTVDNYQGEENDIILLSCVRSNNEDRIGFLEVKNRVCVALSRAKKGKYFIVKCMKIIKIKKSA